MTTQGLCATICTPSFPVPVKSLWVGVLFSFVSAFSMPERSQAETFCGSRTTIGTSNQSDMTLGGNDCLEALPHINLTNWTIENGAKVSVLGNLNDSYIANSEAYIGKKARIAVDPYDPDFEATAKNWTVDQGALVRVMVGGTIVDSTVQNGGRIYVYSYNVNDVQDAPGTAQNISINDGGLLYVYQKGQAYNNHIATGGIERVLTGGVATGTIIHGGKQQVYDGGIARQTQIDSGGQYVFDNGGMAAYAYDTTITGSGLQRIYSNGQAFNTKAYENGSIFVFESSSITDATLHDSSVLWGATSTQLSGQLDVYDNARIEMIAGDGDGTHAESINLHDKTTYLGIHNGNQNSDFVTIDKLTGQGTVVTIPLGESAKYSRIDIDELSGNLNFVLNTDVANGFGDFINILQGSGQHKLTISDSGSEITDAESNSLNIINDQSSGSHYSLVDKTGAPTQYVDGGAYMYQLYHAEGKDGMSGSVWYLGLPTTNPGEDGGDGENGSGNENGGATDENNHGEAGEDESNSGSIGGNDNAELPQVELKTTPSTDAMLAIASVGKNIFYNELATLRERKGDLADRDLNGWRFWTRGIGSHSHYAFGLTDYKLNQKGIEFGGDKAIAVSRGTWLIGGAVSYTDNTLRHERGGKTKIDSYSASVFATYFDKSGFYFDSIFKANRFKGDVQTRMTNGEMATGSYSQNAIGGAVEIGYHHKLPSAVFIEPYLRGSFFTGENKTVKLNNGMEAKIGRGRSAKVETGVVIGREYKLKKGGTVKPYIRAAVEHEFIGSEQVTINQRHRFKNNYSGTTAKIGAGIDAKISKKASLYGEIDYRTGGSTSSSISGNLGLRIRF